MTMDYVTPEERRAHYALIDQLQRLRIRQIERGGSGAMLDSASGGAMLDGARGPVFVTADEQLAYEQLAAILAQVNDSVPSPAATGGSCSCRCTCSGGDVKDAQLTQNAAGQLEIAGRRVRLG
jgi:hypothetical protein